MVIENYTNWRGRSGWYYHFDRNTYDNMDVVYDEIDRMIAAGEPGGEVIPGIGGFNGVHDGGD